MWRISRLFRWNFDILAKPSLKIELLVNRIKMMTDGCTYQALKDTFTSGSAARLNFPDVVLCDLIKF